MNWRCLPKIRSERIHTAFEKGPLHRQYRHQAHLYQELLYAKQHLLREIADRRANAQDQPGVRQAAVGRKARSQYERSINLDRAARYRDAIAPLDQAGGQTNGRVAGDSTGVPGNRRQIRYEIPNWAGGNREDPTKLATERILWLRAINSQRPKAVTLLSRFDKGGMNIQLHDINCCGELDDRHLRCSLIMLECVEMSEQDLCRCIDHIRGYSNVPLIVLTDNTTLDWLLIALRQGADALFTLNTPDEIILARFTALLRRWNSG